VLMVFSVEDRDGIAIADGCNFSVYFGRVDDDRSAQGKRKQQVCPMRPFFH
jgi:hypothetical protein